jgi:hypothetical protein
MTKELTSGETFKIKVRRLYSSTSVVKVTKLWMKWVEHVASTWEIKYAYSIFVWTALEEGTAWQTNAYAKKEARS